jgi:hypothetical protein
VSPDEDKAHVKLHATAYRSSLGYMPLNISFTAAIFQSVLLSDNHIVTLRPFELVCEKGVEELRW